MGQVLALAVQLESVDCGECGGSYALNERYISQARTKGTSWHCPYCQVGWGYVGNGENEKLKKQLAAKEQEIQAERARKQAALERANHAETVAAKAQGALKRAKKLTAAGVCPCCPRTFVNLQRHIAGKHPEYAAENGINLAAAIQPPKGTK